MSMSRNKTLALATRLGLDIELTRPFIIRVLYGLVLCSERPVQSEDAWHGSLLCTHMLQTTRHEIFDKMNASNFMKWSKRLTFDSAIQFMFFLCFCFTRLAQHILFAYSQILCLIYIYIYIYIYRSFLFDFGYQIIRLVKAGLWHLLICHKQGILCVNINGDKRWCELSCQKFLDLGTKSKMSLGSYLNPQFWVQNNL